MQSHAFIKNGDPEVHESICDAHGDVVLSQCKVCGQAEGELAESCPGARRKRAPAKKHPPITMGCVAAIMGVSPSMKAAQVMRQMVRQYHGAESEYESNAATDYNDQMREPAIIAFEDHFKRNVIRVDLDKPLYKHLSSNPLTVRSDLYDGPGLVFIRTPFGQRDAASKADFKTLEQQPHMYAQMQVEMHLAGCKWGVFFQWSVQAKTAKLVELDQPYVDECLHTLGLFYDKYKLETKNKDHLEPLLPVVNNKKVRDALDEYDDLCVSENNIKARKAELMELLKAEAKDRSVVLGPNGRKLQRIEKQGSISYSAAVKKLLPDADLEAYRGAPSTAWTLS